MRTLAALLIGVLMICASATGCGAEPRVVLVGQNGKEVAFKVEIADTPEKREIGLMYRKDMALDYGMIFIFPYSSPQSFWMKNTILPLDMIFISRDQKIVGIVEQAVPFSLDPRGVSTPSQFVLEINGGLAKRHGLRLGDVVRFEGIGASSVME
jgi:uncharacterized membrane protein (UPF0127 family)